VSKKPYLWIPGHTPPKRALHSRAKHDVLRSYLEEYVDVLTQNPRSEQLRLTLVDGFAGGGEYIDSQTKKLCYGSPILMLQSMKIAEMKAQASRHKQFGAVLKLCC
jgi:three-Cys-motif partner protein